jgi:UDP-GlcNAc:undecaprenyl-phosphate/decaprenyl-phosphate GlcNAc-1-phosphate transferase
VLWFLAACLLPSFVVSCCVTGFMRWFSPRIGLIDQPAARKVHTTPTPLGGGVGIVAGFLLTTIAAQVAVWWLLSLPQLPEWFPEELRPHLTGVVSRGGDFWKLVVAGLLIATMGFLDDYRPLPWQPRLGIQLGVAIALASGGIRATVFASQPWIGFVLTVLWIVVLINAFNFLDNMDALSSGIGLIASSMFACVMLTSTAEPKWFVGGVLLVLAGSIAGFLWHNWPPARIFMGDAGSMFIGLMLASLTLSGTFYDPKQSTRSVILAPLCVLAVPLYDFTSVMLIRLSQGRSPFQADKSHFSHRLVELGLNRKYAVLTVHLCTITTGLGALLLYRVQDWTGAILILTMVLCVLAVIAILETVGRREK